MKHVEVFLKTEHSISYLNQFGLIKYTGNGDL